MPFRLPPLRDRGEDIPDLVHHFFKVAISEGLPQKYIEQAALDRMKRYRWPGNIRELGNEVRRFAALYPQEVVTEQLVEAELNHELAQPSKVGAPLSEDFGVCCQRRGHARVDDRTAVGEAVPKSW